MKATGNGIGLLGILVLGVIATACPARAGLDLSSPASEWTPIVYPTTLIPDPSADQQTGSSEGDLVGNPTHAAFYTRFDNGGTPSMIDGMLGFRARVGADKNPAGFSTALFVGMDADQDGALDLFLGINNSGSADHVALWSPGTGANTSPSTTTIETPPLTTYAQTSATYDWRAVNAVSDPDATSYDIDGGGATDYFLSFAVPFSDVVGQLSGIGITIDEATHVRYVMATATQANSLNQDLNGVDGGVNSAMTWAQLGVISTPITATGQLPEPSTALLVIVGVAGLRVFRRR